MLMSRVGEGGRGGRLRGRGGGVDASRENGEIVLEKIKATLNKPKLKGV